jgi:hypothetical protein
MADLRVAVEPSQRGRPTQRIYLDGHEMSGVRRVRVRSAWGSRIASIDLDLDVVSIDPRAVSQFWGVCGDDKVDLTIDADNVDGPVTAGMMPSWTRGPARAYRRPDVFDGARECYSRLRHGDWLVVVGVIYLVIAALGVFMEQALLEYANGLRQGPLGSLDDE